MLPSAHRARVSETSKLRAAKSVPVSIGEALLTPHAQRQARPRGPQQDTRRYTAVAVSLGECWTAHNTTIFYGILGVG